MHFVLVESDKSPLVRGRENPKDVALRGLMSHLYRGEEHYSDDYIGLSDRAREGKHERWDFEAYRLIDKCTRLRVKFNTRLMAERDDGGHHTFEFRTSNDNVHRFLQVNVLLLAMIKRQTGVIQHLITAGAWTYLEDKRLLEIQGTPQRRWPLPLRLNLTYLENLLSNDETSAELRAALRGDPGEQTRQIEHDVRRAQLGLSCNLL